MLALRQGGTILELAPETGGAVTRFCVDGVDILRQAPPGTRDVLETACFALVPYANRIAHGAFMFDGEAVRLPRNFGDHPHALHGDGWQNAWAVRAATADTAWLCYEHEADAWPWHYTAEQMFALTDGALQVTLCLTNRSTRPMPASVGFHPYFPRAAGTLLTAAVAGVWLSDATLIPTVTAPPAQFLDLARGADLTGAPFVDHCHFGWTGGAAIRTPRGVLHLGASPELDFLHVFAPQSADYFCVEPVSAMPDALNRGPETGGLRVLAPNGALTVAMRLSVHG